MSDDEWPPPDLAEWWAEFRQEAHERMVSVPVTAAYSQPQYQRCLQEAVQEAVLRYSKLKDENPED